MANPTTITIPVSLGDIIYRKNRKVVSCRYFGDEYAREDGQPHCLQHEYDCVSEEDGGDDCDAIFQYYITEEKVNDLIMCNFAYNVIRGEPNEYASNYFLNKEDALKWAEQHNKIEAEKTNS